MSQRFREIAFTEEVLEAQNEAYGRSTPPAPTTEDDRLGAAERDFLSRRDSFYMATVNQEGWPYVQHRGGPAGFLKVLDEGTLAFADLAGNRQLLSVGALRSDDRVALILVDYPGRRRLKVLGRAEVREASPELLARLYGEEEPPRAERVVVIRVLGLDWNCPKHVTPRYTEAEVEAHTAPLRRRIAELEAELLRREGQKIDRRDPKS